VSNQANPTCPFCMSALEITDAGGNPWFECGTTMGFKSSTCQGREPMAVKLREAQERIKRLEEAGDALKASGYFGGWADAVNKWIKAKEDKL
jgi:hypothetical protein